MPAFRSASASSAPSEFLSTDLGSALVAGVSMMLVLTAGFCIVPGAAQAASASSPPTAARAAPTTSTTPAVPDTSQTPRSVAARSRMLECGHQWSSMKKAGTATGTWKEFSRGCLAQR